MINPPVSTPIPAPPIPTQERESAERKAQDQRRRERRALLFVLGGFVVYAFAQAAVGQLFPRAVLEPIAREKIDLRLDLNTAQAMELIYLPGIGPALAKRIVSDRETNGPFRAVDDIARVRGIGPTLVERVRPYLFVTPEKPQAK